MATNDTYYVEDLGTVAITQITDDGGIDWLCIREAHRQRNYISLDFYIHFDGLKQNGFASVSDVLFEPPIEVVIIGEIENARGGNAKDIIEGSYFDNILFGDTRAVGNGGNDKIYGKYGNDTIYGGGGDDAIEGGPGSDLIFGGAGNDKIYAEDRSRQLSVPDTIEGGAGADTMIGINGPLDYVLDTLSYLHSSEGVALKLDSAIVTIGAGGDAEGDQVSGFAHVIGSDHADALTANYSGKATDAHYRDNTLTGRGGNDTLGGGNGADSLYGGTGRDKLDGGAETDWLEGGAQADQFTFTSRFHSGTTEATRDTIADFSQAEGDRINLTAIDAIPKTATDNAFRFIGTDRFTGGTAQLRYEVLDKYLIVEADLNGDKTADFSILVLNTTRLTEADFVL